MDNPPDGIHKRSLNHPRQDALLAWAQDDGHAKNRINSSYSSVSPPNVVESKRRDSLQFFCQPSAPVSSETRAGQKYMRHKLFMSLWRDPPNLGRLCPGTVLMGNGDQFVGVG